jgi:AcrR family transcriptional regulator
MKVFWKQGYEGASLSDLTAAMGINRPSLYAAFGDKAALFCRALDRYDEITSGYIQQALNESTARAVAEKLMRGAVDFATCPQNPRGCMSLQGGLAGSPASESIRSELAARRDAGEKLVRQRFRRAQAEGDLPPGASPADLARYVVTVVRGLAVQASSGAGREELRRVIQMAMRAWPDTHS